MAVTGETTGRQCWEVHKDAVTCIIEKHIKDPALVKRLVDAWDSAVDLGVTTAKASPAQKKKKTDRAIRLTSVRQATSVLLSQIGLIACKWCVYRGLHDCCLTTKNQFGQLGDSEQCCALSTQFTHPLTHTHTQHTGIQARRHQVLCKTGQFAPQGAEKSLTQTGDGDGGIAGVLQSLQFRGAQFGRSAHCDGTVSGTTRSPGGAACAPGWGRSLAGERGWGGGIGGSGACRGGGGGTRGRGARRRCCRRRWRQARLPQARGHRFSQTLWFRKATAPLKAPAEGGAQSVGGAECRGRNHFRASVHTCRDESWLHDALASHGAPRGKDFGYRIGVGARGVGGTDSSSDALIDAQCVSLSSCLGYTGGP